MRAAPVLVALSALALASCGGSGGSTTIIQPEKTVTSSTSSPASDATTSQGGGAATSLDSPAAHDKLVNQLNGVPGVSPAQAGTIADCAIAKFKADGYQTYDGVPKPVATKAGQDCAQQILTTK